MNGIQDAGQIPRGTIVGRGFIATIGFRNRVIFDISIILDDAFARIRKRDSDFKTAPDHGSWPFVRQFSAVRDVLNDVVFAIVSIPVDRLEGTRHNGQDFDFLLNQFSTCER